MTVVIAPGSDGDTAWTGITIKDPGVYDITADAYHADPVPGGSLSHSGAIQLLRSPAQFHHWITAGPMRTPDYDFGRAAHTLVLGVGAHIVAINDENWYSTSATEQRNVAYEQGAIPLTPSQHKLVQAMATAFREHPVAGALFQPGSGRAEQSLFWVDGEFGVWRRAMLDWLHFPNTDNPLIILDYKTTSIRPNNLSREINNKGYLQQAAWYLDAVEALGLTKDREPEFAFVFQTKEEPYAVTLMQATPDMIKRGRDLNRKALDLYREYKKQRGTDPVALMAPRGGSAMRSFDDPSGEQENPESPHNYSEALMQACVEANLQLVLPESDLVSLPGDVDVRVVSESFHSDTISTALFEDSLTGSLTAVLVPDQGNPHSEHAVAVYLQSRWVGYLPDVLGGDVQLALLEFSRVQGGRLVSCPAEVRTNKDGYRVVLHLDPGPLGLSAEALDVPPELAVVLNGLLTRLDQPAPHLDHVDAVAREMLCDAEKDRQRVNADRTRSERAWPRVEEAFREAAEHLTRVEDPLASQAWLGVARATRYQSDRRDDVLAAFVEALYLDREYVDAWCELVDYASFAPHVPTLTGLLARCPIPSRALLLHLLLKVSYRTDRCGNMSPGEGRRLRAAMLDLVVTQGDHASAALLRSDQ